MASYEVNYLNSLRHRGSPSFAPLEEKARMRGIREPDFSLIPPFSLEKGEGFALFPSPLGEEGKDERD
jgi:hypothetical protein